MRIRLSLCVVLALLPHTARTQAAQPSRLLWQVIAPGIEYREFYLEGPNHIYVARMQRDEPQVTLETGIAQGKLSGGLETVHEMAARYDQAINFWGETWGRRNQVVVAINGSYYDPESGVPTSGQVQSGWYAKRFDEQHSVSGFAWTLDRQAFIGGCIVHLPEKQQITTLRSGDTQPFDGVNVPRGEDELIIYTPQYDATTLTDDKGVEVSVELSRPLLILPLPAMITGTVREVSVGEGSMLIPFDHVVLSASGGAGEALQDSVRIGDVVGISQEMRHLEPDCRNPQPVSWEKTYAGLGSGFVFLRDGVVQAIDDLGAVLRSPRTAVVFNERYIFFIVVDGRDHFQSQGMSIVELAVFARNTLGAVWGAALDGGGSSTMIVNGELKNKPNPDVEEAPSGTVERAVANGLMMVRVLPFEKSSRFRVGDNVATEGSGETLVRLGPGTNYPFLAVLAPGSQGIVLKPLHDLNGVLAKGYHWWKVAFGDVIGWVAEERLTLIEAP